MPIDEIITLVVAGLAVATVGFLFGMFALARVKEAKEESGGEVPHFPGLTPEQTFGLAGIVVTLAGCFALVGR